MHNGAVGLSVAWLWVSGAFALSVRAEAAPAQDTRPPAASSAGQATTPTPSPSTRPVGAGVGCTPEALTELVGQAMGGRAALDKPAWQRAVVELPPLLACQEQVLSAGASAATLRFVGLDRAARDPSGMAAAFRGAASLDPGFVFRPDLAPPGGPVDLSWRSAVAAAPPAPVALEVPAGVRIWVNGAREDLVYPDRASVVQVQVRPRGVVATFVLDASAAPAQPAIPHLQDALDERERAVRLSRQVLVASGATAAVSLLAQGAALALVRFDAADGALDAATGLHLGAAAAAGGAVGLAVAGAVIRW